MPETAQPSRKALDRVQTTGIFSTLSRHAGWLMAVACFVLSVVVIYAYTGFYPQSDEWPALPLVSGAADFDIQALWAQQNEHRLILPRLIWYIIFQLSDGDYRFMRIANMSLFFLTALFVLHSINRLRGQSRLIDAAIPMALISLSNGAAWWGFHTQFTCSSVLSLIFLFALLRHLSLTEKSMQFVAGLSLLLLPLCGLNGVIPAIVFSVMLVVHRWRWRQESKLGILFPAAICCLALAIFIVASTKLGPKSAHWYDADPYLVLIKFLRIAGVNAGVHGQVLAPVVGLIVVLGGAISFITPTSKARDGTNRHQQIRSMLLGFWLTYLAVFAAIALGRANVPWNPGLSLHYYPLVCAFIVVSLYISDRLGPAWRNVIHGLLATIVTVSFIYYSFWGFKNGHYIQARVQNVITALKTCRSDTDIIKEFILVFHFVDKDWSRQVVEEGFNIMREVGVEAYNRPACAIQP